MGGEKLNGFIPGNTNPDFMYLTGSIVSWWARIEGIMVHDIMALRTWPFSYKVTSKRVFPMSGKAVVKQWRDLIQNGYREFDLTIPDFSTLVNEALELLNVRNTLAHSFWPYGQLDKDVLEVNWIKRDDGAMHGVSRGTYRATLHDLDRINTRLAHVYNAVMAASMNSHRLYQLGSARYPAV